MKTFSFEVSAPGLIREKLSPPLGEEALEFVVQLCVVSFGHDHRARISDVYVMYPRAKRFGDVYGE